MEQQTVTEQLKSFVRNWAMALLHPRPIVGLAYLPRFIGHWIKYAKTDRAQKIGVLDLQPCLGDWSTYTPFDAHYFYQGAWLARQLSASKPIQHIDVGSSVLAMSVLSAWTDTVFVDYRPLKASLPGLSSVAGNILQLPFADRSVSSLSCLHVIEHIGLGRYGDPIDADGARYAAEELQRLVGEGGILYLSTPIGRERVCFNAHRVFASATILTMFSQLQLIKFSY